MRTITGKCHCGNIAFELQWPDAGAEIAVRACNCEFCTKHGGVYTSHPGGALNAFITERSAINRYRFGTSTAEFYVCTRCGAVPFVTSAIGHNLYAVVNVNTFEHVPREQLKESVSDFSEETTESRLARRQRNWIPRVSIEYENADTE